MDTPAARPPLRLEVVTEPAQLEGLRAEWVGLMEGSAANEPMLSPAWLLTWWRVYGEGTGRQLRVGLFYEGNQLVGLAPLQARRYRYRPWIPFRRLEFLGADVDEEDGVCSEYLNVIAARGAEPRVAQALARGLQAGAFGPWDELVLGAMDGEGPMPGLLEDSFRTLGLPCARIETGACPYLTLPPQWETYLKSLGKKRRQGLVHSLRDFEEWAGPDFKLHRATDAAGLEKGKQVLVELHNQRWQAAGERGAFGAPRFRAFHDQLMPALLAEGKLELLWLEAQGKPAAAVYNIVVNNKIYYYQCGRDLQLPRNLRPGFVILGYTLREAIAAGRREFDFLLGVSPYKMKLTSTTRPLVQFRAFRPSLREVLRRRAEAGFAVARRCRQALRTFLGRSQPKGSPPVETGSD